MLLIYLENETPRSKYVFQQIFDEILQVDCEFTGNKDEFKSYHGHRVSYGKSPVADELFFKSSGLLEEIGIKEQVLRFDEFEGEKCFFQVDGNSTFPFDPFSASFYLLSRYEEYLPHRRDEYGRFYAQESESYKNGFLIRPLVNIWADKIFQLLEKKGGTLHSKRKYRFVPTFDIDSAFAYKEKGFMRNSGGFARSVTTGEMSAVAKRARVLFAGEQDPYDTFEYQLNVIKENNLNAIYFFLMADYGFNDKNVPVNSRKFQGLIKSIADYAEVGIHPSYASNESFEKLKTEVERLSNIVKKDIVKSRQHFLKLKLPDTYRNLIELDIKHDYSMGYAPEIGFRSGTCSSYYFFDLDLNLETGLKLHPFAVMDGTLREYMNLGRDEAIEKTAELIRIVKKHKGEFICLWHNHSLSGEHGWDGWREVFEATIQEAKE